jgi:hypothetical protein
MHCPLKHYLSESQSAHELSYLYYLTTTFLTLKTKGCLISVPFRYEWSAVARMCFPKSAKQYFHLHYKLNLSPATFASELPFPLNKERGAEQHEPAKDALLQLLMPWTLYAIGVSRLKITRANLEKKAQQMSGRTKTQVYVRYSLVASLLFAFS